MVCGYHVFNNVLCKCVVLLVVSVSMYVVSSLVGILGTLYSPSHSTFLNSIYLNDNYVIYKSLS